MLALVKRFPFLSWAAACGALLLLIQSLSRLGSGYDDGGFGLAAFLLGLLWSWFAFPFHLASEALLAFNEGRATPIHQALTIALGGAAFILAEVSLQLVRRRRRRRHVD